MGGAQPDVVAAVKLIPLKGKSAKSVARALAPSDETPQVNIWEGSIRSTKTVSSLVAWLKFVRTAPPGDLLMVGRTERTLKHNVVDVLIAWLGRKRCRYVGSAGELFLLGRRVILVGASTEKAAERIQGLTLVGAYVDEAALAPESFWNMLTSRLSIPGSTLFATTNPDSPNHYLKKRYIDRAHELGVNVFHFTLDDNPHLTDAYKNARKTEYGPGTLWYRRYIDGLWVQAEGAIYDMWTDRHVVHALPAKSDVAQAWVGIDYGTSSVFEALLMLHVTYPFDHLLIASEWRWDAVKRQRQMTDKEYADALVGWLRRELPDLIKQPAASGKAAAVATAALSGVIVDPSAASFIRQLYVDGFQRVGAADNAVIDGIRNVSSLLAQNRLFVHESCEGLIEEMPGYAWDSKKQARGEDAPIKENDHGVDTTRYLIQAAWRVWKPWVMEVEVAA